MSIERLVDANRVTLLPAKPATTLKSQWQTRYMFGGATERDLRAFEEIVMRRGARGVFVISKGKEDE